MLESVWNPKRGCWSPLSALRWVDVLSVVFNCIQFYSVFFSYVFNIFNCFSKYIYSIYCIYSVVMVDNYCTRVYKVGVGFSESLNQCTRKTLWNNAEHWVGRCQEAHFHHCYWNKTLDCSCGPALLSGQSHEDCKNLYCTNTCKQLFTNANRCNYCFTKSMAPKNQVYKSTVHNRCDATVLQKVRLQKSILQKYTKVIKSVYIQLSEDIGCCKDHSSMDVFHTDQQCEAWFEDSCAWTAPRNLDVQCCQGVRVQLWNHDLYFCSLIQFSQGICKLDFMLLEFFDFVASSCLIFAHLSLPGFKDLVLLGLNILGFPLRRHCSRA